MTDLLADGSAGTQPAPEEAGVHRPLGPAVTKAVIPAAGLGTRFLPATKATPKEMLPVVDKPAIQYVVEEAVAAGLSDVLVITGRNKRSLEDHFDRAWELEEVLQAKGDASRLARVQKSNVLADMHYIRQGDPRGLGHAVLCGAHHVGNNPFAVLLGDDLIDERDPLLVRMIAVQRRTRASVVALMEVPREQVHLYGCAAIDETGEEDVVRITGMVEKPAPQDAPSNLAVIGRYVLHPRIFEVLRHQEPGRGGEIQLTDALQTLRPPTATARASTAWCSAAGATTPGTGSTTSRPWSSSPPNGRTSARSCGRGCAPTSRPWAPRAPRGAGRRDHGRGAPGALPRGGRAPGARACAAPRRPGPPPRRGRRLAARAAALRQLRDGRVRRTRRRARRGHRRRAARAARGGRGRRGLRRAAGARARDRGADHDGCAPAAGRRRRRARGMDRGMEDGDAPGSMVVVHRAPERGQYVRAAGGDVDAGEVVLRAGARLSPRHLALLAAVGRDELAVRPAPRVAVLSTGTELVPLGREPGYGQIHDSNGYGLTAAARELGALASYGGIVPDEPSAVRSALEDAAASADLVLTSGGVSAGTRDTVKEVLTTLGTVRFDKVAMQPGMPQGFGAVGGSPVFTLPGNPVSSMVSFEVFVRPALLAMLGEPAWERPRVRAVAGVGWASPAGRRQYVRATLSGAGGRPVVTPVGAQGSHLAADLAVATCLAVVPEDVTLVEPGDELDCDLLTSSPVPSVRGVPS